MKKRRASGGQHMNPEKAAHHRRSGHPYADEPDTHATSASHTTGGNKRETVPDHSTPAAQVERTTPASSRLAYKAHSHDDGQHESAGSADAEHHSLRIRYPNPSKPSSTTKSSRHQRRGSRAAPSASSRTNELHKQPGPVHDTHTTNVQGHAGHHRILDRGAGGVTDVADDRAPQATRADKTDELIGAQSSLAVVATVVTTLATAVAELSGFRPREHQVERSSTDASPSAVKNTSNQQAQSSQKQERLRTPPFPSRSAEHRKQKSVSLSQRPNPSAAKALEQPAKPPRRTTSAGAAAEEACSAVSSGGVWSAAEEKQKTVSATSPTSKAYKEVATILTMSPLKYPGMRRDDRVVKSFVAAAVSIIAAACALGVIGFFLLVRRRSPETKGYCDTEGCAYHALTLTYKLNQSIHPCDDFAAYACSAWAPSGKYSEHAKSPLDGILYSRFIGFREMLAKGTQQLSAGEKARSMHDSCMDSAVGAVANIDDFRQLMQAMGLSWPDPPDPDSNALGVLLSLSFRWQIPLWLVVNVPALQNTTTYRLIVRAGDYIPLLKNQHASVTSGDGYATYWTGFYNALSTSTSVPLSEPRIKHVAVTEGSILTHLYKAFTAKKKNPAILPLDSIGNFTPPLSSSEWQEQLTQAVAFRFEIVAKDRVAVSDMGFLGALGGLFTNYTHHRLLTQLSWLFVQVYAPISDPKLQTVRYGDTWKTDMYRPILCAHHVESSMKMLVFALDYVASFTEQDTRVVNAGFTSLIDAASRMLNRSQWLDDESKRRAADKIASVKAFLWPSKPWIRNEFLSSLYHDYPSDEETFGDYWIKARLAMAKHNRTPEFEATLNLPDNIPPPIFGYDYITNSVEIPIGIVNRPLFYNDGNKAMFYGGLGFLMALQVVAALDNVGITWDSEGKKVESIITSDSSRKAFREKGGCLEDEGIESIFPEVPALEIANDALQRAIRSDPNEESALEGLTPEKVFFMTLCYTACVTPDAKNLVVADCRKVVRNSPAFQAAFGCSRGTKMNAERKCSFFA